MAKLIECEIGAVGAHNESCATTDQWRDQRDRADRAEAALASAKADALREAADEMVGTHGTSPHARFLRDRADQIARTDERGRGMGV